MAPTASSTATPTATSAATQTATATPTNTATLTASTTATPTPTATITPVPSSTVSPTATPTVSAAPGIYGTVGVNGVLASGVSLTLNRCTDSVSQPCTTIVTTTTGINGDYAFLNVSSLAAGEFYGVRYLNGPGGGNPDNPSRLWWWYSRKITPYVAGSRVSGGDFDIGDVVLQSPAHGASVLVPATFAWLPRGVVNDNYSHAFASQSGTELCSIDPPGLATTQILTTSGMTACGLAYGTSYQWYVYVTNGPTWSNGYGASYYYRNFTLRQP